MDYAIKIDNLTKRYKGSKTDALKGLNLEIRQGEVFGFLGPNGAGKSTTIKLLMGLLMPSSGEITVMGRPAISHIYRRSIGYLPENPSFYDYLTAEELLQFVGRMYGMSDHIIKERTIELLKRLELYDDRRRPIRGFSKGMVQRLGLAQSLVHDPDIYILDEPMSGLDPLGRILVAGIITSLRSAGKAVFMSTHILNDIETICDRVGVIVRGELRQVIDIGKTISNTVDYYEIAAKTSHKKLPDYVLSYDPGAFLQDTTFIFNVSVDSVSGAIVALSRDKDSALSLITPKKKGLTEIFTGLVNER